MLATIDRGFEILIKVFPDDNLVNIEFLTEKIAHDLSVDFVALSFELLPVSAAAS